MRKIKVELIEIKENLIESAIVHPSATSEPGPRTGPCKAAASSGCNYGPTIRRSIGRRRTRVDNAGRSG